MTGYKVGLLTTFLVGIFIVIGALIALVVKNKDKIVDFSIGLAFGVITTLGITDLIPEIFEVFDIKHIWVFLLFSIIGFFVLKILDHFIPAHHEHAHDEHKMSKTENRENLIHIGMITTLTLILHNIIEGMAVYSTSLSDSNLGIALAIGVGFHNIPLGMIVASSFYHSNKNIKKTILSIFVVSISTFFGGFLMFLFNLTEISDMLLGILLSLTFGMLVFIVVSELFPRIIDTKQKKVTYSGIVLGVVILILSMFIG